ncbi:hypothetical protein V6N12_007477 [Hibiscus sabdariffa]|uniref:Knl1 C-terminal RWD domain-containing protein n=1 Tax=Hibiscus sabdariffa TaxID=183260 RepID=A0ABR2F1X4_9ROSI
MSSKLPDEPPCDTQGTDEESIAFRKKRLRRVSFADREITSVHIFNRDDDYETPPDSTPELAKERENEVIGLFKGLVDSDDDDGDLSSDRKSFFRPMETPSPGGSSTIGSATSNDEDNFFGPVSAEFIRPGRLSDSAASDDNHDITMDSTAFSMHFRSIARSESGDLNTSTGVPLASDEKTPFQATTSSHPESLMVLTKVGKIKSQSPVPINTFSGGRDSNEMSLVGESMHRYDYGRLCPTLEALLAEGSEFSAIPHSDSTIPKLSMTVVSHGNGNDCMEPPHFGNSELCIRNNDDMSGKGSFIAQSKLVEATSDSATTLTPQSMHDCLSNSKDGPVAEDFVDHQTPNQRNKLFQFQGDNEISEVWFGTSVLNSELIAVTDGTPVNQSGKDGLKEISPQDKIHTHNVDHASSQLHRSPLAGSIHSLSSKRQQVLLDTTNAPSRSLFVTPSPKQPGSVLNKGSIKDGSVASIPKSSSELKIPEPSPCASASNDGAAESSPMGHKDSLSGDLKLQDQDNSAIIISRQECNSVETILSSDNLTATTENRTPPSTSLAAVKIVDERGSNGFGLQNTFSALKLQPGGPEKNIQTTVERTCSTENIIEEQMKVSYVYASPGPHTSKIKRSPQKSPSRKKQTQSPTSKEPSLSPCRTEMHNALHGDNMQLSVAEDMVSLNCSSNVQRIDDFHGRPNPSPVQDIQSSSKRKRTSEDNKNRMQQSQVPKFCKVGEKNMEHTSEYSFGSNLENERIEAGNILMNWTDINMLDDKLLHQQKVNILEMLCSEIQSQLCSAYNQSGDILHKRVAETRQVLYRIVYGKAKLQLMHVKRERLLKQVELLRTGVQESQMLKLNFVKHHSVSSEKDAKLGDNSFSVTFGYNLEGIQLWEVDDLQNRNGHHNVVLNYHGFISQSLVLNPGRNSSIFVANKLNDMNISKNFPNMDACSAFLFVFNRESTKKYVGTKSLAQETQRTSSLFRNLLDVVEEVQIARLEIRNMTVTSFHSPSAKQLDLQLAFVDFESGIKVTMNLDVTCLNCGVYPWDILPYDLQSPATGAENLKRQALSAEIKAAVENLRAGYLRVIRLYEMRALPCPALLMRLAYLSFEKETVPE